MKARKKGTMYEISYRCPGHPKPYYERFETLEEANLRIAAIEYDRTHDQLRPPTKFTKKKEAGVIHKKYITVSELMDEYVQIYGLNHWSESTLSCNLHRIRDYIKPYIGGVYIQDLTTYDLDAYYSSLLDQPAVVMKGHKEQHEISPSVINKVHALMRGALNQAIAWGCISTNPAMNCTPPDYDHEERAVWSVEEAQRAIELCEDPVLKTCMILAVGCSARIGEVLGLTWDCIDIPDGEDGTENATLHINKELKRCVKENLDKLDRRGKCKIYRRFPEQKENCTTVLVLKNPKNKSSVRTVYLPKSVAEHLLQTKKTQQIMQTVLGELYKDYNLVISHPDGSPVEERIISGRLKSLIQKENLPPVVFHSLRHCSTSMKLKLSGGNIKAVQGDTGHAQARMVTEIYSHIQDEDRRTLAQKVEEEFFRKKDHSEEEPANTDVAAAVKILYHNPALASLLLGFRTA